MARRSARFRSSRPLSSAIRKTIVSTPSCVSFRFSRRARSSGPMSEIVARTGWPCSPKTSQNVTGHAGPRRRRKAELLRGARSSFSLATPAFEIPLRSPLTSARKTGTPMRENCSAMTCSVIVLPVPVAPVMQPWRLASREQGEVFRAGARDDQWIGHADKIKTTAKSRMAPNRANARGFRPPDSRNQRNPRPAVRLVGA